MSKNILVELGGIDVTSYLRRAVKTSTYGDAISKYEFEFTKNVNDAVAMTNALTVEVWLDADSPPTTKVFDGFIDLFKPETGMIKITAKDKLAYLINKQVMHYYDSSVPGDAAYPSGKLSNIFADLVVTYGGLSTISYGITVTTQDSGTSITQTQFPCRNADVFERCRKLAETLNWVFYYKASDNYVYFEPKNYTINTNVLTVGINIVEIPTWEYDRSEMINDLRLEGAQQLVSGSQVFKGDGVETEFTLTNIPEDISIYYNPAKNYVTTSPVQSEIKVGNVVNSTSVHDYEVDKKNKTITFTSFVPATGTTIANLSDILTQTSYYAPIPIHMSNDPSKAIYGTYAKTITLTDVINLGDAWNRANNILEKYCVPFKSAKLKVKWTSSLDVDVGESIRIVDNINSPTIDQFFTIYKITDYYPECIVEIEVGDKQYTIEEYQANVIERLKRLEEGLIGSTDDFSEIIQTDIGFGSIAGTTAISGTTTVLVQDINDSFVIGHPDNAFIGTTFIGNRCTTNSTATYNW